jgi:hypothetical protein
MVSYDESGAPFIKDDLEVSALLALLSLLLHPCNTIVAPL